MTGRTLLRRGGRVGADRRPVCDDRTAFLPPVRLLRIGLLWMVPPARDPRVSARTGAALDRRAGPTSAGGSGWCRPRRLLSSDHRTHGRPPGPGSMAHRPGRHRRDAVPRHGLLLEPLRAPPRRGLPVEQPPGVDGVRRHHLLARLGRRPRRALAGSRRPAARVPDRRGALGPRQPARGAGDGAPRLRVAVADVRTARARRRRRVHHAGGYGDEVVPRARRAAFNSPSAIAPWRLTSSSTRHVMRSRRRTCLPSSRSSWWQVWLSSSSEGSARCC